LFGLFSRLLRGASSFWAVHECYVFRHFILVIYYVRCRAPKRGHPILPASSTPSWSCLNRPSPSLTTPKSAGYSKPLVLLLMGQLRNPRRFNLTVALPTKHPIQMSRCVFGSVPPTYYLRLHCRDHAPTLLKLLLPIYSANIQHCFLI